MVIKYFVILVISLLWPCWLHSQELPSEGAVLNYRLIPFQFSQAGNGSLEIAPGYFNNEDSFSSKIIKRIPFSGKKLIGEVPQFGGVYTWRVVYKYSGKKADHQAITGGKLHHFSTASFPLINRAKSRLRILQPGKRLKDEYVLMDGCSAMYDMDGNPVWFLPDMGGTITDATVIRDMKMTPQGTITFLRINPDETKVYEIDIDGRILWQGPDDGSVSGENSEHYHHEFTRLANGHYMIMGNEQVAYQVLSTRDCIQLYW